eukprot:scaffold585_cov330-Pavlova_lutheri.AAC.14
MLAISVHLANVDARAILDVRRSFPTSNPSSSMRGGVPPPGSWPSSGAGSNASTLDVRGRWYGTMRGDDPDVVVVRTRSTSSFVGSIRRQTHVCRIVQRFVCMGKEAGAHRCLEMHLTLVLVDTWVSHGR